MAPISSETSAVAGAPCMTMLRAGEAEDRRHLRRGFVRLASASPDWPLKAQLAAAETSKACRSRLLINKRPALAALRAPL